MKLPRTVLRNEVLLVLALSLGASAIYSVLSLINKVTRSVALSQQTTTMNNSYTPDRPWLDLAYQVVGLALIAVPAFLVIHLLGRDRLDPGRLDPGRLDPGRHGAVAALGLDRRRPGFDVGTGAALALVIGVPGIGLYLVAHAVGINTAISASNLVDVWWAVPVLMLRAAGNGILEEVVVVGYLMTRLRDLGWGTVQVVAASALLRGTYHLYQGWGAFIGNAIMGVVFALFFLKYRRIMPLIIAHTLLDIGAFVGYYYLADVLNLP